MHNKSKENGRIRWWLNFLITQALSWNNLKAIFCVLTL